MTRQSRCHKITWKPSNTQRLKDIFKLKNKKEKKKEKKFKIFMVEFFLNEQSLTLFSRGNFTEISMISYVCIHTEFYWNCFFRTNSCFDKISDQTFLNQPALLHLLKKKTLWTFSLIVNSACLVAQWDQREIPSRRAEESQHTQRVIHTTKPCSSCTGVVWTLPTPGLVSVAVMFQGCVTAGRVVTPKHTQTSFLCVEIHSWVPPELSSLFSVW